ncbi:MAG: hypothetical protein EOO05_05865 [Chitinophagaceae bacterium]|nr:MAG: hypothetical protein EOO05_05865 [Chitinophagaceae bacterium]
MTETLTLSIIEIVLLLFGAIILGITVHFFIASRRNLNATANDLKQRDQARDEWKVRYFNDIEKKDKELNDLRDELKEAQENTEIYVNEAAEVRSSYKQLKLELQQKQQGGLANQADLHMIDHLRNENLRLKEELDLSRQERPAFTSTSEKPDYLEQLRLAQSSLMEHNQKINALLGNIDVIKEKEEKEREILHDKEVLAAEVDQMREELTEKEKEINSIRQKEKLTLEMTSMLDSAYNDFQLLQEKLGKLEQQLSSSKQINMEFDDLREEHLNTVREVETLRQRGSVLQSTNQQLQDQLNESEDKLREANFQRQQLQKRVAYLEELNNDLQVVSDANKKLEVQLRKIGELESALNVVSEERDQLAQRASR